MNFIFFQDYNSMYQNNTPNEYSYVRLLPLNNNSENENTKNLEVPHFLNWLNCLPNIQTETNVVTQDYVNVCSKYLEIYNNINNLSLPKLNKEALKTLLIATKEFKANKNIFNIKAFDENQYMRLVLMFEWMNDFLNQPKNFTNNFVDKHYEHIHISIYMFFESLKNNIIEDKDSLKLDINIMINYLLVVYKILINKKNYVDNVFPENFEKKLNSLFLIINIFENVKNEFNFEKFMIEDFLELEVVKKSPENVVTILNYLFKMPTILNFKNIISPCLFQLLYHYNKQYNNELTVEDKISINKQYLKNFLEIQKAIKNLGNITIPDLLKLLKEHMEKIDMKFIDGFIKNHEKMFIENNYIFFLHNYTDGNSYLISNQFLKSLPEELLLDFYEQLGLSLKKTDKQKFIKESGVIVNKYLMLGSIICGAVPDKIHSLINSNKIFQEFLKKKVIPLAIKQNDLKLLEETNRLLDVYDTFNKKSSNKISIKNIECTIYSAENYSNKSKIKIGYNDNFLEKEEKKEILIDISNSNIFIDENKELKNFSKMILES
jgi:hypothetical protein